MQAVCPGSHMVRVRLATRSVVATHKKQEVIAEISGKIKFSCSAHTLGVGHFGSAAIEVSKLWIYPDMPNVPHLKGQTHILASQPAFSG